MKICLISTTIMTCPPAGYSGLEMLAWLIAKGLNDKGHEVLMVTPRGSTKTGTMELHETTLGESEQQAYSGYHQRLEKFDVVIDHSWQKWAYVKKMEGLKVPVLGVCHAPIHTMYNTPPPVEKPCLVAISKDQAAACKEHLKCDAEVAYNGVDVDFYKPTGKQRNNRYLFLARISTIKGPEIACEIAQHCGVGLDVIGDDKITGEPALLQHVQNQCALTPGLRYIGPQSRAECVSWFNKNKCLLHTAFPFREPFGLAPVEAQLCGCPVIASNNGALRETICPGETGYLASTPLEIENLIRNNATDNIKPARCREWASQFSYSAMISRYETLCQMAIEGGGW